MNDLEQIFVGLAKLWKEETGGLSSIIGARSTPAKAKAARRNAKLGGWPKGKKRGKRKARKQQNE